MTFWKPEYANIGGFGDPTARYPMTKFGDAREIERLQEALAQPEQNQFKPDYDTQAVLVEEQQRMGAEIVALHIEIDTLHKILITRAEQIVGLQDEIRNLTGEE